MFIQQLIYDMLYFYSCIVQIQRRMSAFRELLNFEQFLLEIQLNYKNWFWKEKLVG
jgi:hypothetical protein